MFNRRKDTNEKNKDMDINKDRSNQQNKSRNKEGTKEQRIHDAYSELGKKGGETRKEQMAKGEITKENKNRNK